MLLLIILVMASAAANPTARAATQQAEMIEVIDGDTLRINGRTVDLAGIDAPEATQGCQNAADEYVACGEDATRALLRLVAAPGVTCEEKTINLVVCRTSDGTDLADTMVRQGNAFALDGGVGIDYVRAESEARAGKRGVWAGTALTPWLWRERTATNPPIRIDGSAQRSPSRR